MRSFGVVGGGAENRAFLQERFCRSVFAGAFLLELFFNMLLLRIFLFFFCCEVFWVGVCFAAIAWEVCFSGGQGVFARARARARARASARARARTRARARARARASARARVPSPVGFQRWVSVFGFCCCWKRCKSSLCYTNHIQTILDTFFVFCWFLPM